MGLRPPAAGPLPWVPEHRWMVIAGWGLLAGDYCLVTPCFLLHRANKRLHESPGEPCEGPRERKWQYSIRGVVKLIICNATECEKHKKCDRHRGWERKC